MHLFPFQMASAHPRVLPPPRAGFAKPLPAHRPRGLPAGPHPHRIQGAPSLIHTWNFPVTFCSCLQLPVEAMTCGLCSHHTNLNLQALLHWGSVDPSAPPPRGALQHQIHPSSLRGQAPGDERGSWERGNFWNTGTFTGSPEHGNQLSTGPRKCCPSEQL